MYKLYIVPTSAYRFRAFGKSLIPRLRELTPSAKGGQEAGSRNLGIELLPDPVFEWEVLGFSVNTFS